MTNLGLVLLISSSALASLGIALFFLSRHSAHTSQGAALTLFSHGAFATAGLLFVVSLFHVHSLSPLVVHLHSVGEALADDFDCDFSLDCVAVSSVLIAGIVLGSAAVLGQLSSRLLLRQNRRAREPVDALPLDLVPMGTCVWLVRESRPDAFAVAVLRADRRQLVRVEDIIVVTTGMREILTQEEFRATLAHEAAHVRAHDSRYLPFVRTLSAILFLDPVLGLLARRLAIRYEFGADEDAAWATRDPRALARALMKVSEAGPSRTVGAAFRGTRGRPLLLERIERLLTLADRMDAGE
jgi:Zn-dependent protease with chaperone function